MINSGFVTLGGYSLAPRTHKKSDSGSCGECGSMDCPLCPPDDRQVFHRGERTLCGDCGEEDVLRSCYRGSLELAREQLLGHIAFPCIAAGVYEFPGELAARIAIEEVQAFMAANSYPRRVTFCCFQEADLEHYQAILARV